MTWTNFPSGGNAIKIKVDTQSEVIPLLNKLRRVLTGPVFSEFLRVGPQRELSERMEQRFAQEGDSVVGKWAPLRWSTQRIRSMSGYYPEHPINERSGEFKNWMTAPGTIRTTKYTATYTLPGRAPSAEAREKLITAQRGRRGAGATTVAGGHPRTVARPVLGVDRIDMDRAIERFRSWFILELQR